jgi:hypothetical protein
VSPTTARIVFAFITLSTVVVSATVPGAAPFTAFLWRWGRP